MERKKRVFEVVETAAVSADGAPVGSFRTTPVADDDQVIRVLLGDVVTISGARFRPDDPDDELKLEVEWGDGERSTNGCGPCRVEHVYAAARYVLKATVHDRRFVDRGSVTQELTVVVRDPAEPADDPPPTPEPPPIPTAGPTPGMNCHSIAAATGACPTGASQFCLAPGADGHSHKSRARPVGVQHVLRRDGLRARDAHLLPSRRQRTDMAEYGGRHLLRIRGRLGKVVGPRATSSTAGAPRALRWRAGRPDELRLSCRA